MVILLVNRGHPHFVRSCRRDATTVRRTSVRSASLAAMPQVTAAHEQAVRARIVDAALRVFAEKGYHGRRCRRRPPERALGRRDLHLLPEQGRAVPRRLRHRRRAGAGRAGRAACTRRDDRRAACDRRRPVRRDHRRVRTGGRGRSRSSTPGPKPTPNPVSARCSCAGASASSEPESCPAPRRRRSAGRTPPGSAGRPGCSSRAPCRGSARRAREGRCGPGCSELRPQDVLRNQETLPRRARLAPSLHELVRVLEHGLVWLQAERLRRLQVHDEVELPRRFHGQVPGAAPLRTRPTIAAACRASSVGSAA